METNINIYTDGSSLGNPGPGGYGIILEWKKKNYIKEYSKGFKYTTNNRMELLAVVVALEKIKIQRGNVKVFTDSKYIVDSVELKRIFKWKNNNFKKKIYLNKNETLSTIKAKVKSLEMKYFPIIIYQLLYGSKH